MLVKDQSAPAENGVYVVGVSPARGSEFDTYDEHPGSLIAVEEGTANADTLWLCTSNIGGTLNTTAIAFSALVFTAPSPSATVAALDGTGAAGSSAAYSRGDHKHSDANRPTNDEKAALVGTSGTPSAANKFVTDSDSRLSGSGGTVTSVDTDGTYFTGGPITSTGTISPTVYAKSAIDSAVHALYGGI